MSIVYRHFAGMIELGLVDDDLRFQFRSQSRAGMKPGNLGDPDLDRIIVDTDVIPPVNANLRFGTLAH
jgi:hypothetical protein